MKKKIAIITGITGQDGSYLAELLLEKNYIVHGIRRRSSSINTSRIDHLHNNKKILGKRLFLHYGDLLDSLSIEKIIKNILPDEIYNLAAQSHVKISFDMPEYTSNVNSLGTLRILEIIKNLSKKKKLNFIKHQHPKYLVIVNLKERMKMLLYFLNLHMQLQNFFHIGLQKIIEIHMDYIAPMEFYLIMSPREED